jgi:hypothetical protein
LGGKGSAHEAVPLGQKLQVPFHHWFLIVNSQVPSGPIKVLKI